ncbi:hypothetical protein MKW94_015276 [Papaver nudicaule]|uniref:RING-type E3 ubiquitin transferase n=1 Tax=Papaver nudicaule TaxID=74823 RepID=A0AA41VWK7_PAPNU|nr:hypothetical protein [Papaver nudicaule]
MQGQRSTLDSFADTFGLDHGASSSNAGMNQQLFWNDVLNPVEGGYQECPPPLGEGSADVNVIGHEGRSLSGWSLGEPSSSERTRGHMIHNEAKTEHLWSRNHAASGPSLEERHHEAANTMSLGSVHLNLNNNLLGNGSLFSQASSSDEIPQNLNLNAGYTSDNVSGGFMEPSLLHSAGRSDPFGTASGSGGYLVDEGDARPGCSLDGRRLSCKRKTLEGGVSGQSSSLGGNSSCYQQAENSLWHSFPPRFDAASSSGVSTPSMNPLTLNLPEPVNTQSVVGIRGANPALSLAGNAETSHRSFRMRTNPANQQDVAPSNLPPTGYPARHPHGWSPHQLSSRAIPLSQSLDLRPPVANVSLESRSQATHDQGLPQNVHPFSFSGAPSSRSGSSSSSTLTPAERPNALREGVHLRMPRNISEHPMFVAASEMRNLAQEPTSWSLANGSSTTPGNLTSNPRGVVHPSPSSAWAPNPTSQYSRRLSEAVRRSLFSSAGSESGAPTSSFPPLRSGPSASTQDGAPSAAAGQQGNPQPYPRSAFLMDRQGDGVPLSFWSLAAATEGRSRLLSEVRFRHIRNVLDMVRRGGDGLRFEDVMILDQSVFFGVADLHDRHRDMRLDVDNMSYEELLALEERIGDVSTGLSEEVISKCLKQRKFCTIRINAPSETEPCCICQEEYAEGDDLGTLECGHDFHSGCVKQWLKQKNLCPVCKTTALVT